MHKLGDFVQNGEATSERASKYQRYSWVIGSIMDEILDEMAESDASPETIGVWFAQMGQVIQWCGSGDNSVLPLSVRKFLLDNEPELAAASGVLAITAGGDD